MDAPLTRLDASMARQSITVAETSEASLRIPADIAGAADGVLVHPGETFVFPDIRDGA